MIEELTASDEKSLELISQEAALRMNLCLLTLYGACLFGKQPFLVYEDAIQGTFANFFVGSVNRELIWKLFAQACVGLILKTKGMAHGNLKCSRMLLSADQKAKISGIGFGIFRRGSKASKSSYTRWAAPELLSGEVESPSHPADVYAFGMYMLEAWSGDIPWSKDASEGDILKKVCAEEMPPRPEAMSDRSWQLVQQMCHANPSLRPTLTQVYDELRELMKLETPVCRVCKFIVSFSAKFCSSCGVRVGTSKPSTIQRLYSFLRKTKRI